MRQLTWMVNGKLTTLFPALLLGLVLGCSEGEKGKTGEKAKPEGKPAATDGDKAPAAKTDTPAADPATVDPAPKTGDTPTGEAKTGEKADPLDTTDKSGDVKTGEAPDPVKF